MVRYLGPITQSMTIHLLGMRFRKILREEVGENIETMESITMLRVPIDPKDKELRIYWA